MGWNDRMGYGMEPDSNTRIGPITTYEPFAATVICRREKCNDMTRQVTVLSDGDEFFCPRGHRMEGIYNA